MTIAEATRVLLCTMSKTKSWDLGIAIDECQDHECCQQVEYLESEARRRKGFDEEEDVHIWLAWAVGRRHISVHSHHLHLSS